MKSYDRTKSIGASDAGDLMSEPPWGCRRRLWYEKRGVPPDTADRRPARLFERGKRLEAIILNEYERETGRKVARGSRMLGQGFVSRPEHPEYTTHLDGRIMRRIHGGTPGVLEGKSMNMFAYRHCKREGLPPSYILQLQWAMYVTDWAWGSFAILWPDGWELAWFDVLRDDELIARLVESAETFWRAVQNGPAPDQLGHEDQRCRKCSWRPTCWNLSRDAVEAEAKADDTEELPRDDSLLPLLSDLQDANEMASEAAETVVSIRERIRTQMGDREALSCGDFRVYHRLSEPIIRLDAAKLRKDYPKIAELCSTENPPIRSLRIYDTKDRD